MEDALPLDRLTPTLRPDGSNSGTQRWRELLFVHWALPADAVRPLVPPALELDPWDGRAWVGIVPFRMEAIRPWWLPRVAALDFLELNLRTYVHHRGRPGVFFFSLEASSVLAVAAARATFALPYWWAAMRTARSGDRVTYSSARRTREAPRFACEYEIGEALGPSTPGTLEHFLLERYLLFATRAGRIVEGQVHHRPYPARRARVLHVHDDLIAAAGMPRPERAPDAVHYSAGVEVEVFGPRTLA